MKSIMEQASSIVKAIEKAWISADRPKEFSVKIFEKEEKNFFGLTTKPAKIGIFFSDKNSVQHPDKGTQKARYEIKEQRPEFQKTQHAAPSENKQRPEKKLQPRPVTAVKESVKKEPKDLKEIKPQRIPTAWNDAMVNVTAEWMRNTLDLMEIRSVDFTSEITGKILKLTFSQPLLEDISAEKQLFRSLAHLVMASLRNQFKQEIKDLKILLLRPE